MLFTESDLIGTIRSLRKRDRAGVAPHLLYKEVSQRLPPQKLLGLLTLLRNNSTVAILGRNSFFDETGPLCIIDVPLDDEILKGRRWDRVTKEGHDYYCHVRIYILADGFPSSIANKGVVKRFLSR